MLFVDDGDSVIDSLLYC